MSSMNQLPGIPSRNPKQKPWRLPTMTKSKDLSVCKPSLK